ncbi:MAG TPA: glycosyltransferase family 87 protein [Candidatus Dormibacteraeota bacterium]
MRGRLPYLTRLAWVGAVPVAAAAIWVQLGLLMSLLNRPGANAIDYRVYRVTAEIGLRHGWGRIYDEGLQRAAIVPLWPRAGWPSWWTSPDAFWTPFVSPPQVAWLAAPFDAIPTAAAVGLWMSLMAVAVVVTAALIARRPRDLAGYLLLLVISWVTTLAVVSANVTPLVGLGVILSWRLLEGGRTAWAGVALGLAALKPQLIIGVPVLLLVLGYWRTVLTMVATGAVIAAAALLILGISGVQDYLKLLRVVASFPGEQHLSALQASGMPWANALLTAGFAALLVGAAWRLRRRGPAVPVALGLLGSVLLSPYLNVEDFVLLLPAAMLLLRLGLGPLPNVLAFALVLTATPASQGIIWPELLVAAGLLLSLLPAPWPGRESGGPGAVPVRHTPSPGG